MENNNEIVDYNTYGSINPQSNWNLVRDNLSEIVERSARAKTNWDIVKNRLASIMEGRFPGSRLLNQHYWLEKLEPKHRSIIKLRPLFDEFLNDTSSHDFFLWLSSNGKLSDWEIGVSYLEEQERNNFRFTFDRDQINFSDFHFTLEEYPYDWAHMIFVVDQDNNFYGRPKIPQEFHHSSFFSGAPVLGAGTFRLNHGGEIRYVANLSGHYQPTKENFKAVIRAMALKGAIISEIEVRYYEGHNLILQCWGDQFLYQ